jgi:NADPH-dependent 2,4-dienoyl-CoA reductase/sulfur reductase-like enzyme
MTGHEVSELDLKKRQVHIQPINGGEEAWEAFDRLVIATGATPIRPPIAGLDTPGVTGAGTIDDAIRLRKAVDEDKPRKAVIVGGGYIGIEMAEAFLGLGLEVSVVEMLPQVMSTLDPDMGALVSKAMSEAGINLYLDEKVEGFEETGGRLNAVRTAERTIDADIAVLALGVRPNTRLAAAAGIPLGIKDAIKVNEKMETEVEGIWAVGDCAETLHLVSGKPVWVALGDVANKEGRVAGINIGGGDAGFPGIVGTAATKFKDTEIARTGLQEGELEDLGLDYVGAKIEASAHSHYLPDKAPLTVKLFAEKGSGRLLGGQIVGLQGAAARINTLATALHAGLTVGDLVNLDLGYSPPYSPVWDAIHIAARQTLKRV